MENEKYFHPIPEQKEAVPKSYEVHFDDKHFGDAEQSVDTDVLVGQLNNWWDNLCKENRFDPQHERLEEVGYYIIELGKNALEYANGGEIKVIFEPNKVIVVVTDAQGWDGDPNDDILYGSPGHGLSGVKRYADEFIIETNGAKFTKVAKKIKLVRTESDVQQGSKITFIKNF